MLSPFPLVSSFIMRGKPRIPVSIQELKKLRILDVEENNLDSIPSEIVFKSSKLLLFCSEESKAPSSPSTFRNLANLTYLAIAENDLHSLPPTIGRLEKLEKLYLNDNFNLHDLPPELALCCGLQIMSIENCPLSKIPMEVVSQGPSLVIQYLRLQQLPFAIAPAIITTTAAPQRDNLAPLVILTPSPTIYRDSRLFVLALSRSRGDCGIAAVVVSLNHTTFSGSAEADVVFRSPTRSCTIGTFCRRRACLTSILPVIVASSSLP
ncbi:unnamed protein product, partial [Dibothriocephalus latus]